MANDFFAFEQAYGREMPPTLKALFDDSELLTSAPHRGLLPGKPFAVEVQYYLPVTALIAEDVANQRFAFAVDWDGYELLVDLNGADLPVLWRERTEVERLDFTLAEFLAAVRCPLVK